MEEERNMTTYLAVKILAVFALFVQLLSTRGNSSPMFMGEDADAPFMGEDADAPFMGEDADAPHIELNIPNGSLYWIGQPPLIRVSVKDDTDPSPRVRALLNGEPIDVSEPLMVKDEGVYFLTVEASDSSGKVSYKSVAFQVTPLRFKVDAEVIYSDIQYHKDEDTASIDIVLAVKNAEISPRMIVDSNDPRIQRPEICRVVSPYSWTLFLTDDHGRMVSDTLSALTADCDCLSDVVVIYFHGKVSVSEKPEKFAVLGVAVNSKNPADDYIFESLPASFAEYKPSDILAKLSLAPCPPPGGGGGNNDQPCERVCRWVANFHVAPKEDKDQFLSAWCLANGLRRCGYRHVCRASTRISGEAFAFDNCLGCVANTLCSVSGGAHLSLVHTNICPPCDYQKVNAFARPTINAEVRISGSNGFGGDRVAAAAGMIKVAVDGGGGRCKFKVDAVTGCQVGSTNPIKITLGGGRGPEGGEGSVELTLVWNGLNMDSCEDGDVGNCSEVDGTSIRADIVTIVKLMVLANGGIGQTAISTVWAKARILDSASNTTIGGRCSNAVRNLRAP
jgi:hypothetical protein